MHMYFGSCDFFVNPYYIMYLNIAATDYKDTYVSFTKPTYLYNTWLHNIATYIIYACTHLVIDSLQKTS